MFEEGKRGGQGGKRDGTGGKRGPLRREWEGYAGGH